MPQKKSLDKSGLLLGSLGKNGKVGVLGGEEKEGLKVGLRKIIRSKMQMVGF